MLILDEAGNNLLEEGHNWMDTEDVNGSVVERFTEYVNADPELKAHRDYIEVIAGGFGERAFHWLWKLLVDEMPPLFRMLEVGVYKGQILSLVKLLANRTDRRSVVIGVTMLSDFSGTGKFPPFPADDYAACIEEIHHRLNLVQPQLIVGDSTSERVHSLDCWRVNRFDIVYIDGCHEYEYVVEDLLFYTDVLKPGGYLVVDDCANFLHQPPGFFQGIMDVSRAVRSVIETDNMYDHLLAVMHNRVWRKL